MRAALSAALCGAFALSACAPPPPAPPPYVSDKAKAALPKGTDLSTVHRRDDGCYYIQTEDELSGYFTVLKYPDGTVVCDEI